MLLPWPGGMYGGIVPTYVIGSSTLDPTYAWDQSGATGNPGTGNPSVADESSVN